MQILVICRPAEGVDPDEFRRLVPAETAALRDLKGSSVLTGAWSPGRPGAVLTLDASDETEADRLIAGLPLVQAGLVSTEIIPLHPMEL